jgi:hypothetical protein
MKRKTILGLTTLFLFALVFSFVVGMATEASATNNPCCSIAASAWCSAGAGELSTGNRCSCNAHKYIQCLHLCPTCF